MNFISPFRWIWLAIGIAFLAVLVTIVASTLYFGFVLGRAVFFAPHVFPFFGFPFFGLGFIILGLLIVGFVLRLVFLPWRRNTYYSRRWFNYDPAMDSLRQRYARGEITREQFDQMASDLERHR
jgi:putative membrane protein